MKLFFKTKTQRAFTLVEIMIVIGIIGLLCAVAIPNYVRARANSQASACINNLRKIDEASGQFAIEHHKSLGASVSLSQDLTPYISLNKNNELPPCPAGGVYVLERIGDQPVCTLGNTVTPGHVIP